MQVNIADKDAAAQRQPLDRWLGVALMVAAVVQLIAGLLHPVDSPVGMVQPLWQPVHVTFFLTLFVVLLAVIRIYGLIASSGGWLDAIAITLLVFGIVGFECLMLLEFAVFPQLAANGATLSLLDESSPLFAGPLSAWLFTIAVVFSAGGILFAIALIRSADWPRWASALLFLAPVVAFSPPLPLWAWQAGLVVFSVGFFGLGRSLWKRTSHR